MLEDSKEVGDHHGLMYYTLGQRGGIGIGGMKGAEEGAWFVLHKDIEGNRLVVGQGHEHPLMHSTILWSEAIDWVAGEQDIPETGFRCTAKPATVSLTKRVLFSRIQKHQMVFVLNLMSRNVQ